MDKLRVFTAFSGYDSQCMALDKLGIDYDLVGWSEIDKYAIQAHNAVYPQYAERNFGDISKVNWDEVPDFDLFTYSSPCQDFSNAGKQAGGAEGSGTRSSLLWECRRAILAKKPKYLVFENVAALVGNKFIKLFNKWQLELESYGYANFAKVLNAKDYGVPQNRERIFMVSILCTESDPNPQYFFPKPIPLKKRLKDVLEKDVDEKYYLSEKTVKSFTEHCDRKQAEGCGFKFEPTPPPRSHSSHSEDLGRVEGNGQLSEGGTTERCIKLGRVNSSQDGKVSSVRGLSFCLSSGHFNQPKIVEIDHEKKT